MVDVLLVAGARPNFMKVAPVFKAIAPHPKFNVKLVHTGQHYDGEMSGVFFGDLDLPPPDVYLGGGSGTHAEQTGRVMVGFERAVKEQQPDLVIVVGDVNSTLGCSLVAAKAGVPVAHVEAGLRSFDRTMPEEVNRVVTDSLSRLLFTTSEDASENLAKEGHPPDHIHFVGNTMIDTLLQHRAAAEALSVPESLGLERGGYILVTLHRPVNVDKAEKLRTIIELLAQAPLPVVFPIHPRTRTVLEQARIGDFLYRETRIKVIPPAGYLEFLNLQMHARVVVTDSGGVQEETTILGVPCLTLREETERPVTVTCGTNRLIGTDPARILPEIDEALKTSPSPGRIPPLWDGRAAERIAVVLDSFFD